ncbi:MAG: type II toxin-antitoxin system RelE/ParE family toxin [Burkholderiales bacterium]|nr:type II toxin-antitoxin system RelE/ParE family toxin [Burkholderiales bacterium]
MYNWYSVRKPIRFVANSLEELQEFPQDARRAAGYQLDRIQRRSEPEGWKPLATIGPGVGELRIRAFSGAFRVIYVARFEEAVYVLHCFQKTTRKTAQPDLKTARSRYRFVVRSRL